MPPEPPTENPLSQTSASTTRESSRDRRFRRGKGKRPSRDPPTSNLKRFPKFTGEIESLKDHIYDLGYSQSNIYTEITKKIAEYCDRNYTNRAGVNILIEELTTLNKQALGELVVSATQVERRVWKRT